MSSVIIIDDEIEAVEILKEYFDVSNIDVFGCGYDGKDAVELYEKYNPDIILLDLDMPNFNGFYAIEQIKKLNPESKFIILTGTMGEKSSKKLNELKPHAIFLKPYKITELVTMIKQL